MFSGLNEFLRSVDAEVYSTTQDAESDVSLPESSEDTGIYCDNTGCDLNVPKTQVVTEAFDKRMEWKAKDGSIKYFCHTCARAVIIWVAKRD
jgi:hypothetical protein